MELPNRKLIVRVASRHANQHVWKLDQSRFLIELNVVIDFSLYYLSFMRVDFFHMKSQ